MINFSSSIKKVNMQLANMQDGNHKYHQVYLRLVHSIHRLMKLTQCKFHRRQSGLQRGMVSLYLEVKTCYQTLYDNAMAQGAATPFHLSKKFSDTKTCIFWCKTTWGTTFTKGVLPLVGEPR